MSKRFDICQGRESNGRTFWNKIGSLWQNDDGKMSISFDALPVAAMNPKSGQVETRAMVFESKPRGQSSGGAPTGGGGYSDADYGSKPEDDSIPF